MNISSRMQSVEDARRMASRRLPKALFQMFESGSGSNATMRANLKAFEDVMFRPRGGVVVPQRDLRTTVLGHEIALPVIISSVGHLALGHCDGEAGVARAASDAGTIQFVSGAAGTPIEEIMAASHGPVYYQVYYYGQRETSEPIIQRARDAGCAGLVLNIDSGAPVRPRDRPARKRARLPQGSGPAEAIRFAPQLLTKPSWTRDFLRNGQRGLQVPAALRPDGSPMTVFESLHLLHQRTFAWDDLPWIREIWDAPIVIKGVLTAEDARRAVDVGARAIVVSNHGGNGLDGALPTLSVLPEIVAAVGDETDVLIDSGIRRGTDVTKAVALGAKAASLGRAYLYPLLAAGEPGVRHILSLFAEQIDEALAFLGCPSVEQLDPSYIRIPASWSGIASSQSAVCARSEREQQRLLE
jgi:isopentenyl diphosphate isomerase/L-lactate dehydrogenase-like FMN-dependent dehydrogenase